MNKQTKKKTPGETTPSPKGINQEPPHNETNPKPELDVGFRVFKQEEAPVDEHDWFFEACLRMGMPINLKYWCYSVDGFVIWVGEDHDTKEKIEACFEKDIPETVFLRIAANAPKKAFFFEDAVPSREAGLKIWRYFQKISPETEIQVVASSERPEKVYPWGTDPFKRQVGGDHLLTMKYQPMDFFIRYGLRPEFTLAVMSFLKYLNTKSPEELDKLKHYMDFIDMAREFKFREIDLFVEQFEDVDIRDTMIHILTGNTDEVRRRIEKLRNKSEEKEAGTNERN